MRSVASFALLLLVLVVSLDFLSWSEGVEIERVETLAKRRAHRIRAFSTGWNFRPVRQGITNQFEGALVDDRWYRAGRTSGLRVISIPPDGGEILLENFALMGTDVQVDRFIQLISKLPVNTTVILASKQNLGRAYSKERRESPERVTQRRERIGRMLRGMGVRSNPEDFDHLSFVYLCVRRPEGFVPIAEKFSLTRGVGIALNLNEDVSIYDSRQAQTTIDNRWLLTLKPELAQGERLFFEGGRRTFKEVGYSALRIEMAPGQGASVNWDVPEVCEQTITPGTKDTPFARENIDAQGPVDFEAKLAWKFPGDSELVGLQFILRVNGRRMGDRFIYNDSAEQERWILWKESLATDVGPIESVEIEVQRVGEGGAALQAFLTDVQLSAGELYSF